MNSAEERRMQERVKQNIGNLTRRMTVTLDAEITKPKRKFTVNQVRKEYT